MRTLRLTLAGTAMLMVLGGLGGFAMAQPDDEGNGGFTLTYVEEVGEPEPWTREEHEGFTEQVRPATRIVYEASDPRLSGTWTEVMTCRQHGTPMFEVCVGSVRVENDGGTWLGQSAGTAAVTPPHMVGWTVLEGQGDYAGLMAVSLTDEEKWEADPSVAAMGVIFDFGMPPMPELPASS
jgi:hypothetical protein